MVFELCQIYVNLYILKDTLYSKRVSFDLLKLFPSNTIKDSDGILFF